jgi:hypothetical protein
MKNTCPDYRKRSLGGLRSVPPRNHNAPCMLGKMTIQAPTLKMLMDQLLETGRDEVVCNLAAWINNDARGEFITVEISPDLKTQVPASGKVSLRQRFGTAPSAHSTLTPFIDKYWVGNNGSASPNDRSANDSDYR